MATMLKKNFKEKLIKQAMEIHKLKRKDAVKLVRSIELQQEVRLSKAIDNLGKSDEVSSHSSHD